MWFIYALLGAVGKSYSGFFRKKMAGNISAAMFMWVSYSIMLLALLPVMLSRWSQLFDMFWHFPLIVLGASLAMMAATQLNLEALKREELSFTAPLNAFVPVFTLIIAGIFLNENPPRFGLLGVLVIVIGAYVINIKPGQVTWYAPLTQLVKSRGAQLSLCVALCYAINSVLMKMLSNRHFDSFSIMFAMTFIGWAALSYVPFTKYIELKATIRSDKFVLFGAAISSFASSYFHILAVANTYTSYATSVRRLEMPIAILLGWRYLKETNIRNKLLGSFFMVAGAIIMAVS